MTTSDDTSGDRQNDHDNCQPASNPCGDEALAPVEYLFLENIPFGQLTEEELARNQVLLEAAIGYARRGWRVIPVWWIEDRYTATGEFLQEQCACPRGRECASPGKHPVLNDWVNAASSDESVVREWWRPPKIYSMESGHYPLANLGGVMGKDSGVFAWDCDPRNGGEDTENKLIEKHGDFAVGYMQFTGSGGHHWVFEVPADFTIRNAKHTDTRPLFGPGIDIKGEGGLIVLAPSVSLTGPYEVHQAHNGDPQPAPNWVLDVLRARDAIQRGEHSPLSAPVAPVGIRRKYGETAVKGEAEQLARMHQGSRNDQLNKSAFALGRLSPGGMVTEDEAWEALREACRVNGVLADDGEQACRASFNSGWRKGQMSPFQPDWHHAATFPARPWDGFGNGERMVDHFGDQIRYSPGIDSWRVYSCGRWEAREKQTGAWYARKMIESLPDTEAESYDEEIDDIENKTSPRIRFLAWANRLRERSYMETAATISQSHEVMRIAEKHCDADPLLINLRNGTWDVRQGKLIPHDPAMLLTMLADASYDGNATCPRWLAFLDRSQPDQEVRDYLQRAAGYSTTGDVSEQSAFIHYGLGANGKSVFHDVVSGVLGDYATPMHVDTLVRTSKEEHPTEIAMLKGMRYLTASETKAGKQLDSETVKQLTGGESIAARFMRQDFFKFKVVGKIHLSTNHRPHIDDDDAIWRRLHIIHWSVQIPEAERNKNLAAELLAAERPGILRWLIDGAADWLKIGLCPPESVLAAKKNYREDEDIVRQWMEDDIDVMDEEDNSDPRRSADQLYLSFCSWCRLSGIQVPSKKWLGQKLKAKGFEPGKSPGGKWRCYPKLRVRMEIAHR